jgi:capsular exopolysaccharide synthesis family protein
MSRIDEALKVWERVSGSVVIEVDATEPDRVSPFREYPSERRDRRGPDAPDRLPIVTQTPSPARTIPVPEAVATPVIRPHDADLQARLVTGSMSPASLEQYRTLAAALHDWQAVTRAKTVMITSALPREGRTLTVVNLALTLSGSYARRVLVIDADLRAPALHTILDIPNNRGLSEALRDGHPALCYTVVSSRLSALSAGKPGPSPLAGLASSRMSEILEECASYFDWVLIDTPPVGVLPDAHALARLVGGILLVIGARSTPAAAVAKAIAEFGGPDAIVGTILNRVELRA